jgi:hypothetical protein
MDNNQAEIYELMIMVVDPVGLIVLLICPLLHPMFLLYVPVSIHQNVFLQLFSIKWFTQLKDEFMVTQMSFNHSLLESCHYVQFLSHD